MSMKDLKIKLGLDINDFKAKMKDASSNISDFGSKLKTLGDDSGFSKLSKLGSFFTDLPSKVSGGISAFKAFASTGLGQFALVAGGTVLVAKALKSMFDAGLNNAKWFAGVLGSVIDGVMNIGSKAIGIVKDVSTVGQGFQSQMAKVGAISGATGKDFDSLKNKAKELGASTRYSATEVGQAFEYMGMA